mmetsp:Transcript_2643/g.5497  ORF Transcript_2643/g.5497 Transcript_2643/m.5497 type:complete len:145 (+) Transcript_2643:1080-1514(+)
MSSGNGLRPCLDAKPGPQRYATGFVPGTLQKIPTISSRPGSGFSEKKRPWKYTALVEAATTKRRRRLWDLGRFTRDRCHSFPLRSSFPAFAPHLPKGRSHKSARVSIDDCARIYISDEFTFAPLLGILRESYGRPRLIAAFCCK